MIFDACLFDGLKGVRDKASQNGEAVSTPHGDSHTSKKPYFSSVETTHTLLSPVSPNIMTPPVIRIDANPNHTPLRESMLVAGRVAYFEHRENCPQCRMPNGTEACIKHAELWQFYETMLFCKFGPELVFGEPVPEVEPPLAHLFSGEETHEKVR
jgi:hypothetical protein